MGAMASCGPSTQREYDNDGSLETDNVQGLRNKLSDVQTLIKLRRAWLFSKSMSREKNDKRSRIQVFLRLKISVEANSFARDTRTNSSEHSRKKFWKIDRLCNAMMNWSGRLFVLISEKCN